MSGEYVPTTEEIRAIFTFGNGSSASFDRWLTAHDARIASEAAEADRAQMIAEWRDYLRALWIVANRTEGGLRFSAREFMEVPDDLVLTVSDDPGSFSKVIRADRIAAERNAS